VKTWGLLLVLACGCVDTADEVSLDDTEQAATTAFANDKAAYVYFVGKGLTNFQAAGIVGNLDQESGLDPTIVQYGGGPGRGIAQWSVGGRWDTSANDNVREYAAQQNASMTSLNLQLDFIWYELTKIGYGFSSLKATTTLTNATLVFMDKYEICGTCASSQRISYAQSVLNAYGNTPAYKATVVTGLPDAITLACGETADVTLVVKNTGLVKWTSTTKLGTTEPRDRTSMFAGDDWAKPDRPAEISGSVAAGADGTFAFTLHAPSGADCVPGTYDEHFGLVQEGITWFGAAIQGGPADDQIHVAINLVPGDGGSGGGSDSGSDGAGGGTDDGSLGGGCSTGGSGSLGLAAMALLAGVRRRRR